MEAVAEQVAHALESARLFSQIQASEVRLRESEEQFRTIADFTYNWEYWISPEGEFVYVSPACERISGYTVKDFMEDSSLFEAIAHPDDRHIVSQHTHELLADRDAHSEEYRIVTRDGDIRWIGHSCQPVYSSEGVLLGRRASNRDITDRKEAEVEREQLLADLEARASQLQTAAEVSQAASSILDPDELLPRAVELIRESFNYYYVGIFEVDESGKWAFLRAGTGEAGQNMLAAGHRLEIGGKSMIGTCIQTGEPRFAFDVGEAAVRFDNPYLPDTHSEIALPLISQGQALGAMTIQSSRTADFSSADITVLQTMADQLANAMYNLTLLRQREEALQEIERAYGRYTRESWRDYLSRKRVLQGYRAVGQRVEPFATRSEETGRQGAGEAGRVADGGVLAIPIRLRGQTLGALNLRFEDEDVPPDMVEIVEEIAGRLGLALDNARLLEQTRANAAREQLLGEMTSQVRETLDIETVLKTAAREVRRMLDVPEVVIRLGTDEPEG